MNATLQLILKLTHYPLLGSASVWIGVGMQHGDLASLIELDTEVAEEIIPPQKAHQHRTKRGAKFDGASCDSGDERSLSLMVETNARPGIDAAFVTVREVDP
jgi:hypothetical protein